MGIKYVELSGYKSIKDIKLKLGDINIFIGANGSGKSNFISFFQMLSFYLNSPDGLTEFVNKQGGANSLLYYGSKVTSAIKAKIVFDTKSGTNEYDVELGININDSLYFKSEGVCYSAHSITTKADTIPLGSGGKCSKLLNINSNDHEYGKYFITINTVKNMMKGWRFYQFHDTSANSYIRNTSNADDNSYLRTDGGNLSAFLYRLREEFPENYKSIIDYLKFIIPYIDNVLVEDDYGSRNVKLRWTEKGHSNYSFDIGQMSDGTLRALALITLLEQPILPSVLCIDEPELGLHPEGIKMLGDLIVKASEKSQIIISTQSPVLLDCFNPENVAVCNKINGETTLERLDADKYQAWLNDYTLSEIWDTNIFGGKP